MYVYCYKNKRKYFNIDIDSYIDYYACLCYIARKEDWPINNYALWRARRVGDGIYEDGKWRWMVFDCNSTSMSVDFVNDDTLSFIIDSDSVFAKIWENEEFRIRFQQRILEIADKCFDAEEMSEYIDTYSEHMVPILEKSWARFYGKDNDKLEEFNLWMEKYRSFFLERKSVVESWFK